MELLPCPNPVDEPNLLYKLQNKIKVFDTSSNLPNRGYNLVANSSKYGIVFIGSPEGTLSVYYLKDLLNEHEPKHLTVKLSEKPTHISVNCDQELLAVTGGQGIYVYQIQSFQNQNVLPSASLKCGVSPSTFVSALQWNPCLSDTIALAFFDGTLMIIQVSALTAKKIQSNARCICWSPKGKQLVVGNSDGTLCQYKPDLSPMKSIPAPNLFESAPVEVLAIYWISTYQFAVVYNKINDENSRPAVTIVNTPKGGQPSCMNYEDVCYSMGSSRPCFYYLYGFPQWNVILSASSNSMEIATLGSSQGANWVQWCQSDEARPELPLTNKKQENYPVGLSVDTSAIQQLQWGENEILPHMPLLHVVSQSGLLTIYNIINLNKSLATVCSPPQRIVLPTNLMTSDVQAVSAPQPVHPPLPIQTPAQDTRHIQNFSQPTIQSQSSQSISQSQGQFPSQPISQSQVQISSQQMTQSQFETQRPSQITQPQIQASESSDPVRTPSPPIAQPLSPPIAEPISQLAQTLPQPSKPVSVSVTRASPFATITSGQQPKAVQSSGGPANQFAGQVISGVPKLQQKTSSTTAVVHTSQPSSASKPTPLTKPQVSQEEAYDAALHAEQIKINKLKADQELKDMLVKEFNDFQMELYNFRLKTRATLTKINHDLQGLDLQSISVEKFKKDFGLEMLRERVAQLKVELVRAFAVVAEARTCAQANDQHWSLVDPLTVKRLASIKKLAYYVQTQLLQAQKALDFKWTEYENKDMRRDKSGPPRMIRPILDDVYQPMVKQQEILNRQQAVLRALQNTFKECDPMPTFKSTSLLRNTCFNDNDNLSKLTKNILNMSMESKYDDSPRTLSSQKLEALKDMLANRKIVKIKPTVVELKEHLAVVKTNYEKSVKDKLLRDSIETEKKAAEAKVKLVKSQNYIQAKVVPFGNQVNLVKDQPFKNTTESKIPFTTQATQKTVKSHPEVKQGAEPKGTVKPVLSVNIKPSVTTSAPLTPSYNYKPSYPALNNVARTLFTGEPEPDVPPQEPITPTEEELSQRELIEEYLSQTEYELSQEDLVQSEISQEELIQSEIYELVQKQPETQLQIQKPQPFGTKPSFSVPISQAKPSEAFGTKPFFSVPISEAKPGQPFGTKPSFPVTISEAKPVEPFGTKPSFSAPFSAAKPAEAFGTKPSFSVPISEAKPGEPFGTKPSVSVPVSEAKPVESNSMLKGLLQKPSPPKEITSDANTFMGQKICSPSSVVGKPTPVTSSTSSIFSLKPKSDSSTVMNATQSCIDTESKVEPSSYETGEDESSTGDTNNVSISNVADILKSVKSNSQGITVGNIVIKPAVKTIDKVTEKLKANLVDKPKQNDTEVGTQDKENTIKPFTTQTGNKSGFGANTTSGKITLVPVPNESSKSVETSKENDVIPQSKTQEVKTTTSSIIFGNANASSESTPPPSSIFGTEQTPASITSKVSTSESSSTTSSSSIFASAAAQISNTDTKPTQPGSIFSSSKFGTGSIFGTTQSESPPSTTVSISQSAVSSTTSPGATPTQTGSIFSGDSSPVSSSNIFAPSNQPTQSSIFGTTSVFGTTPGSAASVFSSAVSSAPTSVFGTNATTQAATTTSSIGSSGPDSLFKNTASSTGSSQNIFGSANRSIFGESPTTQGVFGSSQVSVFATTTASSGFGAPSVPAQSVFSTSTSATEPAAGFATQSSVFGTPTQKQPTSASIFGTPTQASQASVFGSTPAVTTEQTGSLFGNTDNLFAAASISGSSTSTPPTGGNIFGTGSSGGFGNTGNIFGGKSTFGQPNATASSIFSGGAAFGQKEQPQQTPIIWGSSDTGNSGGGFGSGFGQQATSQSSSMFGSSGGSFSTPPTTQPFGSPASGSIFGTPQQGAASAFGGSPVFGSKPAFGQPSGFGSSPSFGSPFNKSPTASGFGSTATFGGNTFGAPAFGNTSPSTGFGAPSQQSNAMFESLATQETVTFGNLAQQTSAPAPQQSGFNTSPSFTSWRS